MEYVTKPQTNGYYHIHIHARSAGRFLKTNNERAFISMQMQQLLAARSVLEDPLYAKSLPHHIDLLAYSISEDGIQLLAYCIELSSLERLGQYRSEYWLQYQQANSKAVVSINKLAGEHESLAVSARIHLHHKDWEYDRYSSIGFYLHDRRGDWMRLWRLTRLYENDASAYRSYVLHSKSMKLPAMIES
jgi:hypothetical protein